MKNIIYGIGEFGTCIGSGENIHDQIDSTCVLHPGVHVGDVTRGLFCDERSVCMIGSNAVLDCANEKDTRQ